MSEMYCFMETYCQALM